MNDSIIEGMFVDQAEWNARRAEEQARRNPQPVAKSKPKPAAVIRAIPTDERDPFNILRAALSEANGRAIIRAIVEQLDVQLADKWSQGSVRLALETARRKTKQPAGMDGDFRIDNRVAPAIARYVLQTRPELRGWLELRRMDGESADVVAAYCDPEAELPWDWRMTWLDVDNPLVPREPFDPSVFR